MDYRPYLLFGLSGRQYGLPAEGVQELFLLPAVTPIAEAAAATVGVLNLRGDITPVIDLNQRLGQGRQPYSVKQAVILIASRQQTVGIIVDEVHDVEFIAASDIAVGLEGAAALAVTAGLAKHGGQLITLLNAEALLGEGGDRPLPSTPPRDSDEFLAPFTADDRALLQSRAAALVTPIEAESFTGLTALAIVGLQNERFALGLETIQEFTDVSQITPIPCCPRHIVGNMNLRGEILTLVDVRQFLKLDMAAPSRQPKAVIVRLDDLVAGIVVDAVFDVVYVRPSDIAATPTALHSATNEYIRGITHDHNQMMSIVDLPKLMTHGELVVDQGG